MSALSHVREAAIVAALLAMVTGCGRRDDGRISADPDAKLHAGFPVVFVAPPAPAPDLGAPSPSPSNPLAMNALKHDGPASPAGAVAAPSQPGDPCAVKDPRGPLAMRLRHDGAADGPRRNPLCMRLK